MGSRLIVIVSRCVVIAFACGYAAEYRIHLHLLLFPLPGVLVCGWSIEAKHITGDGETSFLTLAPKREGEDKHNSSCDQTMRSGLRLETLIPGKIPTGIRDAAVQGTGLDGHGLFACSYGISGRRGAENCPAMGFI